MIVVEEVHVTRVRSSLDKKYNFFPEKEARI